MPKYQDIRSYVPADTSEYPENTPYPARIQAPQFPELNKLFDTNVANLQNPEFEAITSDLWKRYTSPSSHENVTSGSLIGKGLYTTTLEPAELKYSKELLDAYSKDKNLKTTEDFVKHISGLYGHQPPTVVKTPVIPVFQEDTNDKLRIEQVPSLLGLSEDPSMPGSAYKKPTMFIKEDTNTPYFTEKGIAAHELMHLMDPRKTEEEGRANANRRFYYSLEPLPQSFAEYSKDVYRNKDKSGHFQAGRENYLNDMLYDQIQNEKRNFNLIKKMTKQKYSGKED